MKSRKFLRSRGGGYGGGPRDAPHWRGRAPVGLRPSALRYHEQVGLLRPAARVGGQRRYHPSVVAQLAVIAFCHQTGFTLAELAVLFHHPVTGRRRWQALAERKLVELDEQISTIQRPRRSGSQRQTFKRGQTRQTRTTSANGRSHSLPPAAPSAPGIARSLRRP